MFIVLKVMRVKIHFICQKKKKKRKKKKEVEFQENDMVHAIHSY